MTTEVRREARGVMELMGYTPSRAEVFAALGDEKRLAMLEAMVAGPATWEAVHAAFDGAAGRKMDPTSISYHVRILIRLGFVARSWRDDRHPVYALTAAGASLMSRLPLLGLGGDGPRMEAECH